MGRSTKPYNDWIGWLTAVALATSVCLPYLVPSRSNAKLRAHFWVGYALAPAAFLHGWAIMKSGQARGASMAGTMLAAVALILLTVQAVLGWRLRRIAGPRRLAARRWHFALMAVILFLVACHVALVRW